MHAVKHFYQMILAKPTAWEGHGNFAIHLTEALKPKVTVDLGVDYGFSTFCFAVLGHGKVYGIDSFEGDEHAGRRSTYDHVMGLREHFRVTLKMKNLYFIKGYFDDVAKRWEKKIDILHIDGLHTYDAVKNDYTTWLPFLNPDGVVLFHDTISFPHDVGRFFAELEGYKHNFEHSHGLGVWTRSEATFEKIQKLLS